MESLIIFFLIAVVYALLLLYSRKKQQHDRTFFDVPEGVNVPLERHKYNYANACWLLNNLEIYHYDSHDNLGGVRELITQAREARNYFENEVRIT